MLHAVSMIGNFHPLLVHLPIGILLLAVVFIFLAEQQKYNTLKIAIEISLLIGAISAVLSCISGYLLSTNGDYNKDIVSNHQWAGIFTAITALLCYYLFKNNYKYIKWLAGAMTAILIYTGHLGGSITHGSDYLWVNENSNNQANNILPIANIQEAKVYAYIVQPILKSKCYSCHSASKQKGQLRLDEMDLILKGGKHGQAVNLSMADEGEIIKRIFLPKENENHMPPIEKPQLTKNELTLLQWWLKSGADFNKTVKDIPTNTDVKSALIALQSGSKTEAEEISELPAKEVAKADDATIQTLKNRGVSINTLAQNTNYLALNFVSVDSITNEDLSLLSKIKDQVLHLKIADAKINDKHMAYISSLTSLTKLYINDNKITDASLKEISKLSNLQYLNISNTAITANGLKSLSNLKLLKQLFVYNSNIKSGEYKMLQSLLPNVKIDSGGYRLQMLVGDTSLLKDAVK